MTPALWRAQARALAAATALAADSDDVSADVSSDGSGGADDTRSLLRAAEPQAGGGAVAAAAAALLAASSAGLYGTLVLPSHPLYDVVGLYDSGTKAAYEHGVGPVNPLALLLGDGNGPRETETEIEIHSQPHAASGERVDVHEPGVTSVVLVRHSARVRALDARFATACDVTAALWARSAAAAGSEGEPGRRPTLPLQ